MHTHSLPPTEHPSTIQIDHICKIYPQGSVRALHDISLTIGKGELFGLVGPDGAGKTTLFRILTTLMNPSSGHAMVDGCDIHRDRRAIRATVGYMPGRFSLYQDLTIEENLEFFAKVFGTTMTANYDMIRDIYVQIEPFKKRRAGKLSGGMKQKLALCCALIHKPTVLFLDEPTTGVDPVSRKEFWAMLQSLRLQGITILVSTPYMDEAGLCDRIACIQHGTLLSINTPTALAQSYTRPLFSVTADNMFRLLQDLRRAPFVYSCYSFGDTHHCTLHQSVSMNTDELHQYVAERGHNGVKVQPIPASIEDRFMELMTEQQSPETKEAMA
jgi:ABC-2 type transport system ATP-binding protein